MDFLLKHDNSAAPISLFYDNFLIKPLNEKGFCDKSIDWKGLGNIGRVYDETIGTISKHKAKDRDFFKKYKGCIELILSDFETLKSREDRFGIYKKHLIEKIPESESIIDDWKNGNVYFSEEKIKLLNDNEIYLNNIEREKNKCIFLYNYALLKEILVDYSCISEFQLTMHLVPFNGLEFENTGVIYQGNPEKEVCEEIQRKINNLPHCKYPIEVANFAGKIHFIIDKSTTVKDAPLMSYMEIKESEADEITTEMEKYLIWQKIDKNNKDEFLNKKKRL